MDNQERTINFFRFEDLRLYHKALNYVKLVHEAAKNYSDSENDALINSFVKSAIGIPVNIAEGSGRNKSQFIYYLKMAKSSIRESVVLSTLVHQQGIISIEKEEELRTMLIEISKMVGALIASLQRSKRAEDTEDDDVETDNESRREEDPNMY